jgi:plastocyanin
MKKITASRTKTAVLVALCLALVACANDAATSGGSVRSGGDPQQRSNGAAGEGGSRGNAQASDGVAVDPRDGGLRVALGEWAVTLEAGKIRPGRVTFVVHNRGTIPHGFEIEAENEDSSGPGSGDGLKAETNLLQPGQSARLSLNLPPGLYKVECFVDGHDDLGMEGLLEVREDAPLVHDRNADGSNGTDVAIEGFTFAPTDLVVSAGDEVTWTNEDPAPHTVTAEDGSFDSGTLEPGQTFSVGLEGNGPVTYRCQIHPDMVGTITVR